MSGDVPSKELGFTLWLLAEPQYLVHDGPILFVLDGKTVDFGLNLPCDRRLLCQAGKSTSESISTADLLMLTGNSLPIVWLPSLSLVVFVLPPLFPTILKLRPRRHLWIARASSISSTFGSTSQLRRISRQVFLGENEAVDRALVGSDQVVLFGYALIPRNV